MTKRFTVVPRGVALVIGCNTFPTWNSYPGLFASLVTGNAVLVKPHPRAVLPLAITVADRPRGARRGGLLARPGALAAERRARVGRRCWRCGPRCGSSTSPARRRSATGWRPTPPGLGVHREGRRQHASSSTRPTTTRACSRNLAFSLSLYSGQMCTTPQNLLVPGGGIDTDEGHRSFDEVAADLAAAVDGLLGDRRGRPRSWAGSSGRTCSTGSPRRPRRATWCCASRGGRAPRVPGRRRPDAGGGRAADAPNDERLPAGVLRAGGVPRPRPAAPTRASRSAAGRCASTAR